MRRVANSTAMKELEANLRRELIEFALVNGANDAETLRDLLITTRPQPNMRTIGRA
jgi:hypothetical protein